MFNFFRPTKTCQNATWIAVFSSIAIIGIVGGSMLENDNDNLGLLGFAAALISTGALVVMCKDYREMMASQEAQPLNIYDRSTLDI